MGIIEESVYLFCNNRVYQINSKPSKAWHTYELCQKEIEFLIQKFTTHQIPYITSLEYLETSETTYSKPFNSRVIITIENQEYAIYQVGTYLISHPEAIGIAKAFSAKGIDSRVEVMASSYNNIQHIQQQSESKPAPKYEQVSLCSYMLKQGA